MGLAENKPKGSLRLALRTPVWLFRMRLGWLITGHFLMITTIGRKSGLPRYAVLEVLKREKESGGYVVASGWGRKSDWFLNLLKDPHVRVDVGVRRLEARADVLPEAEAARLLSDYAQRFPIPFRVLAKTLTGESVAGTLEECQRLVALAPLVRFQPQQTANHP